MSGSKCDVVYGFLWSKNIETAFSTFTDYQKEVFGIVSSPKKTAKNLGFTTLYNGYDNDVIAYFGIRLQPLPVGCNLMVNKIQFVPTAKESAEFDAMYQTLDEKIRIVLESSAFESKPQVWLIWSDA